MTSHNDQIRALIAEIDATLEKPSNFLGRLSGEGAKNRDTLEHLRGYLLNLQSSMRRARIRNHPAGEDLASLLGEATLPIAAAGAYGDRAGVDSQDGYSPVAEGEAVPGDFPREMGHAMAGEEAVAGTMTYGESAALIQQLGHDLEQLRVGLMAPLRAEVNQLQQQRQALSQEVQQLQLHRSGGQSERLLQEFMQTLMTRLQERLVAQVTAQVSQALQGVPQISGNTLAALPGEVGPDAVRSGEMGLGGAASVNGIELDQLQGRTDVLLNNLDSTLKAFAQTLEQNLQGYQQSLNQGLERINRMGGQGEVLMAELVNRLADQMEAQGAAMGWNELSGAAPTLSIGGESPMGQPSASFRQLSSRGFDQNSIALDGPELTLESLEADAFEVAPDASTSSAGIARRRILAAQNSESRAQQSLELDSQRKAVSETNSLEDFYASVGAPDVVQQRAMAMQNRAHLSRPGAIQGHYRNLEDALFDGIPEGDNPWARSVSQSMGEPQLRSRSTHPGEANTYPPQRDRIRSLTDLVDRRFDDFGKTGDGAQEMPEAFAAFYGDGLRPAPKDRQSTTRQPAVKKKPFLSRLRHLKSA